MKQTSLDRYVDWVLREAGIRLMQVRDDGALEDWAELLPYLRQTLMETVQGLYWDEGEPDFAFARAVMHRLRTKMDAVDEASEAKAVEMLRYMADETADHAEPPTT